MAISRLTDAPRLFVAPDRLPTSGELLLDGATQHYLGRVLRLGPGDPVVLLDGRGRVCAAEVTRLDAAHAALRLLDGEPTEAGAELQARAAGGLKMVLLCGLLKGEKMDLVVQKATELGAAQIVPVACQRSVPQLGEERGERRQKRWERIAVAAAQQCRRLDIPQVAAPASWAEAMARRGGALRLLLFEGAAPPLGTVLAEWQGPAADAQPPVATPEPAAVELLIGPEGGFAAAEVSSALGAGFVPVSLGPLTLRAETAALAALAVVQHALAVRAETGR